MPYFELHFILSFSRSELLFLVPADSTCLSFLAHSDLYDGSVAHSLTHSLTHSLPHPSTHPPTCPLTVFSHLHTKLVTHALAPLLTHSSLTLTHSLSLTHSLTHPFSLTCTVTHLACAHLVGTFQDQLAGTPRVNNHIHNHDNN